MAGETFVAATARRVDRKRDAGKLLAFAMCWTWTHARLGHRPSVEEYAEDWDVSVATAYREQATFREVWPEFLTPSDVAITLGLDPTQPTFRAPALWPAPEVA